MVRGGAGAAGLLRSQPKFSELRDYSEPAARAHSPASRLPVGGHFSEHLYPRQRNGHGGGGKENQTRIQHQPIFEWPKLFFEGHKSRPRKLTLCLPRRWRNYYNIPSVIGEKEVSGKLR